MKNILLILLLFLISNKAFSEAYRINIPLNKNILITNQNLNESENNLNPNNTLTPYHSCLEIQQAGLSTGNGIYTISNGVKNYQVACDMTTYSGGWTLVMAAFEDDILFNWDEGIQIDYDPTLITRKSFALNSSELPPHTQMSYNAIDSTHLNSGLQAFNYQYTTGNIPLENIQSYTTLTEFQIHRNIGHHYAHNDPEEAYRPNPLPEIFDNTLTIDAVGGIGRNFSYSPNAPSQENIGYSYEGARFSSNELFAWSIWVR